MCEVTPREVIERTFVAAYRKRLAEEEAARKAKAEADAAERAKTAPKGAPKTEGRNRPDNRVKRCHAFLEKIAPSVEGQHGSDRVYQAARIVWNDFGIDEPDGYPLLQEFNLRADPPWPEDGTQGLRRKWEEAVAKGPGAEGRGYKLEQDRPGWKPAGSRGRATFGPAQPYKAVDPQTHQARERTGAPATDDSGAAPPEPPAPTNEEGPSFPRPEEGEAWNDPHRLARLFVDRSRTADGAQALLQWRDDYHQWDTAWRPFPDGDLDARIAMHCREVFVSDLPLRRAAAEAEAEAKAEAKAKGAEKQPKPVTMYPVAAKLKADVRFNLAGLVNHPDCGQDAPFFLWGDEPHDPAEVIAAPNGLFTLRGIATAAGPFEPPSPRFFTHNALPFEVPPEEQEEPRLWMECLRQWFNGDPTAILALQEWAGLLLSANTSAHKMLLLVGPPRSGKGTVIHVLTQLIGTGNVASTTFAALGENFGLEPLIGKRVAIVPDARLSGRTDVANVVERLLSISGEDAQTVNRKNRPRITTRLNVRFLLATNEIPRLQDASGALASRFEILCFPNSFLGKEDRELKTKLAAELPAILAWAAKGYVRLCTQRMRFTQTTAANEYHRELEELSSPVKAFVRERCSIEPRAEVLVNELFSSWKEWCEQRNRSAGPENLFGRDLHSAHPHITVTQPRRNGVRARIYRGIGLRHRDDWGEDASGTRGTHGTDADLTHAWDSEGS